LASFCENCGAENTGLAFCSRCGTKVLVAAQPAATPPAFCSNCDTPFAPGMTFCQKCGYSSAGAPPVATAATVPLKSNWGVWVGGGAIVVALVIAFLILSGGEDGGSSGGSSPASSGTSGSSSTTSSAGVTSSAGASIRDPKTGLPTGTGRGEKLPSGIEGVINYGDNSQLGAAGMREELRRAGVNMQGIDVFVLPLRAGGTMLVVDAPLSASAALGSGTSNEKALYKAIADSPYTRYYKISQLMINMRGRDSQGDFVITMGLPMTVITGLANGTMTDAQAQPQIVFGQQRR
jgi:hypothetical protein